MKIDRLKISDLSYRTLRGDAIETFNYRYLHYIIFCGQFYYSITKGKPLLYCGSTLIPLCQPSGGVVTRDHSLKVQKRL